MKARTSRKPPVASKADANPAPLAGATEEGGLAAAADVLFGTDENPLTLRDGTRIVVSRAKVAHVGLLLHFFNLLVANLSKEDIITLVTLIAETRAKRVPDLSVEELVTQVFGRSSLLVSVFQATYEAMPKIVSALTPLTEEQWSNMDMDEGVLLAFTVFEVNYHFFSQNLPHATRVFLALAAKKVAGK